MILIAEHYLISFFKYHFVSVFSHENINLKHNKHIHLKMKVKHSTPLTIVHQRMASMGSLGGTLP
jgi:hypothetical protein